jgi:hypothetical protein
MLTVARIDKNSIRVNVIPTRKRKDENAALCAPLSFSGTPEEVDGEMARNLGVCTSRKICGSNTRWRRRRQRWTPRRRSYVSGRKENGIARWTTNRLDRDRSPADQENPPLLPACRPTGTYLCFQMGDPTVTSCERFRGSNKNSVPFILKQLHAVSFCRDFLSIGGGQVVGEAVGPHLPLLIGEDAKFAAGHRAAEKDEASSLVFDEIRVGMVVFHNAFEQTSGAGEAAPLAAAHITERHRHYTLDGYETAFRGADPSLGRAHLTARKFPFLMK